MFGVNQMGCPHFFHMTVYVTKAQWSLGSGTPLCQTLWMSHICFHSFHHISILKNSSLLFVFNPVCMNMELVMFSNYSKCLCSHHPGHVMATLFTMKLNES